MGVNILLTNDDGILAPGLTALHDGLRCDHDVFVVAPESEQSAVGHSITLADPIRVKPFRKNGIFGYAISGTPADCVKIAVTELMDSRPDVLISGINLGANVGINILYSGTVSAATEAAIMGIPALAVSLNTFKAPDFSVAADFVRRLVTCLADLALPAGVSLNVNIPALPRERISGVAWTNQCLTPFDEAFSRRLDPRGNTYYWRGGEKAPEILDPSSDAALLSQGYITLTPLKHDLTDHRELSRLNSHKIAF